MSHKSPPGTWICQYCGLDLNTRYNLNSHYKDSHAKELKSYYESIGAEYDEDTGVVKYINRFKSDYVECECKFCKSKYNRISTRNLHESKCLLNPNLDRSKLAILLRNLSKEDLMLFHELDDDFKLRKKLENKLCSNSLGHGININLTPSDLLHLMKDANIKSSNWSRGGFDLARYNDSGDYSLENCRFITHKENINERRLPPQNKEIKEHEYELLELKYEAERHACKYCNKILTRPFFGNRIFCSRECQYSYINSMRGKNNKGKSNFKGYIYTKKCINCNKVYFNQSHSKHKCDECGNKLITL